MFKKLLGLVLAVVVVFTTIIGAPVNGESKASLSIVYLGKGANKPALSSNSVKTEDNFVLNDIVWVSVLINVPSSGSTFLTDITAAEVAFNYDYKFLKPYNWERATSSSNASVTETVNKSLWKGATGTENDWDFNANTAFSLSLIDDFVALSEENRIPDSKFANLSMIGSASASKRKIAVGDNELFAVPFQIIQNIPSTSRKLVQLALTPQTFSLKNSTGKSGQWAATVDYTFGASEDPETPINLKGNVFNTSITNTVLEFKIPTPNTPTPGSPTPGSPTPASPTPGTPTPGTPTPTPTPTEEGIYINRSYIKSYFTGYQNDKGDLEFRPFNNMTRQEFSVMLCRTLNTDPDIKEGSGSKYGGDFKFLDEDSIQGWSAGGVRYLYQCGIIKGEETPDGFKFNPNNPLKRAELAKMIVLSGGKKMIERFNYWDKVKADGVDDSFEGVQLHDADYNPKADTNKLKFSDVDPNHWGWPYVYTLAEFSVVLGDAGMFRPDDNITRQEVTSIMFKLMRNQDMTIVKNAGYDSSKPEGPLNPVEFFEPADMFNDNGDKLWSYEFVYFGLNHKILDTSKPASVILSKILSPVSLSINSDTLACLSHENFFSSVDYPSVCNNLTDI